MIGSAVPLVMLPAAGRGPGMWRSQVEAFSPFVEVLTPDLGDADPLAPFSIERAADRIADRIAEHPAGRAQVCGLSLGAFVALQLAADHPERVSALVLSGGQARPGRLLVRLNHVLLTVLPTRVLLPEGGDRRAFLEGYRSLFTWDVRHRLGSVTAPTLVLCGSRDRANLPGARLLAAGIPGARLETVDGAGHLWNLTHPERFSATVGSFLGILPAA